MGAGEENTPPKPSKPTSATQETPISTPISPYPDWSSSMQAYYGAGATPPFFASTVASPTPHPYLWGGQHPMMPPYGTPVPYPALYPPGGVYAHPNMAMAPGAVQTNADMEEKTPDGKDRAKRSKVSSAKTGLIGGKAGDGNKTASGSGNDGATQSAESGSDGSSDASDDDANQHDYGASKKGSFDLMLADATNLNIGMDLWNTSPASAGAVKMRSHPSGVAQTVVPGTMDERELKRQKRKQSNRESARRSRLRKQDQAECEELQARVETLSNENHSLRDELQRLSEECTKLTSENDSIKEELTRLCGPEVISKLEANSIPRAQSRGDEGNS